MSSAMIPVARFYGSALTNALKTTRIVSSSQHRCLSALVKPPPYASTSRCDTSAGILIRETQPHDLTQLQKRYKKNPHPLKQPKGNAATTSNKNEEDDNDDDEPEEENPLLADDDDGLAGREVLTASVNSLRLDAILKSAMKVSRVKIEEAFYKGDIYVNGERPSKKSQNTCVNDEIVLFLNPDHDDPSIYSVKKLDIVSIPDFADSDGRCKIKYSCYADKMPRPNE